MWQDSNINGEDVYSRNFTSSSETTTPSSTDDISATHINIIIGASTVIISFTLLIFIFMYAKKLQTTCCQDQPELGTYDIVTADESMCGDLIRQNNCQSELNPILDINSSFSENNSLWYDSEYDNLSLNPEVRDSDILDSPPDYEHPPGYETATRRSSRTMGNHVNI